jgi:hypothetical protein
VTIHTSDFVRDRALCDLIDAIDAMQERLADTCERANLEALRSVAYEADDVLAAAAGYLQELREERLRTTARAA